MRDKFKSIFFNLLFIAGILYINEPVLHTVLKRLNCQMIAKMSGMRASVADVNYGDAAILPAQKEIYDNNA